MKTRRARPSDAEAIHHLVSHYAAQGLLLPRSMEEIREHWRQFLVLEDGGEVAGCVAIDAYGNATAEIRSLAVEGGVHGRGLGRRLLEAAIAEAGRQGIEKIFAVTHAPKFFTRRGFKSESQQIPREKIERDCKHCAKAATCELVAVTANVPVARSPFRVLQPAERPLPA